MSNFIIYQTEDGKTKIDVQMENETVWLTQAQMAELFERDISVISRHIKNIFDENELSEKSNLHFLQNANSDKPITLYSLDVIISVFSVVAVMRPHTTNDNGFTFFVDGIDKTVLYVYTA